MATVVRYNGVELHNCLTREFRQEVVYDPSNTDKSFNRFHITVEGICHTQESFTGASPVGQYVAAFPVANTPGNLQSMHNMILGTLGVPRGEFLMFLEASGGETQITMLEATGQGPSGIPLYDVENGPKPKVIAISEIVANKIYKVAFSIEISLLFCNISRSTPFVLNNRWSIAESMDDNFFTTRTIHGRLRLAASAATDGTTVPGHAVKYLVVPPLEDGFKRQSIDYVASENQLECEYTIVDRQIHKAPPWPATTMEVTHSASTKDGYTSAAECECHLEGDPSCPSLLLMVRAIQIVRLRLDLDNISQEGGDFLIEDAKFTNYIGARPAVSAYIRIGTITKFRNTTNLPSLLEKLVTAVGNGDFTDENGNMLLKPLPNFEQIAYVENQSPIPAIYGYDPEGGERSAANLFILHCYLQDPCGTDKAISKSLPSSSNGGDGDKSRPKVRGYEYPKTSLPEGQKSLYSPATDKAIYTYCAAECTYHNRALRVQLPIALDAATQTEDDQTCIVAQLGAAQWTREIVLHYERKGKFPAIPAPLDVYDDNGLKGVLLKSWQTFYPPQLTNDSSGQLFRIDAHFVYALNRAPKLSERLAIGRLPYINTTDTPDTVTSTEIYGQDGQSVLPIS